jgi:hypothetical protein
MNYIKPEDIKEYVGKNPTGIAGHSEELSVMVNHFAELIVRECIEIANKNRTAMEMDRNTHLAADVIKQHFGVEE